MIAEDSQRKEVRKMERSARDEMPGMGDMNMVVVAMKEPQRTEAVNELWKTLAHYGEQVRPLREWVESTIMMEKFIAEG